MNRIALRSPKVVLWLAVCAGLLLVIGANAHLVYMAVMSQPECVAHARVGETAPDDARFGAARSSCNPQTR
jgi:methionine-rich copper-binding protein CopC